MQHYFILFFENPCPVSIMLGSDTQSSTVGHRIVHVKDKDCLVMCRVEPEPDGCGVSIILLHFH